MFSSVRRPAPRVLEGLTLGAYLRGDQQTCIKLSTRLIPLQFFLSCYPTKGAVYCVFGREKEIKFPVIDFFGINKTIASNTLPERSIISPVSKRKKLQTILSPQAPFHYLF